MGEAKDDQWTIVEPGVLALPTTGYEIRYEITNTGLWFSVYHNGKRIPLGGAVDLGDAKRIAARHMRDLIAIGLEP